MTESPKKRSNPSCPMDRRASKSCSFVHCLVKMALKVVRGHSSAEGLCVKKLDVTELAISQLIDLSDGWEKARKTPCDSLQTLSSSFCHWRPVSRSSPLRHKARRDQWGPSKRACSCWGTMMRRTGMLIRMRTGQCCGGYKSSCCGRKKKLPVLVLLSSWKSELLLTGFYGDVADPKPQNQKGFSSRQKLQKFLSLQRMPIRRLDTLRSVASTAGRLPRQRHSFEIA